MRTIWARGRLAAFQQRHRVVGRFAGPFQAQPGPRVLAVITHVADRSRAPEVSVERLERTVEGLLESLAHTRLELVLNTLPQRHVAEALPAHQRSRLDVREQLGVEPMFLGFEAQGEFARRADEVEWFIYLEDDLVVSDSLLLEKLAYFNGGAPSDALLLPHRYEFWDGRKVYIDLVPATGADLVWNRLTQLDVGDWKFAEFQNPHSGFYGLSQVQLSRWLQSGRRWYGLISFSGPRESAATGSLAESFRLYKPHPQNMNFLEIRHWDTKYAERWETERGDEQGRAG